MNSMLGELLPLAIGIALSPFPVVAQILMLFGKRARSNGPAFMLGWVLALLIWGGIMLFGADAGKIGGEGTPSVISSVIKFSLGLLFWIENIGLILYQVSMWVAGITQWAMWRAFEPDGRLVYPDFIETAIRIV